jgi:branched-chain amino acid transport system permease protein
MAVIQSLIDAIAQGAIFALVAIGIGLVFGVMRLVNFAQASLLTAAGYTLAETAGWPKAASIVMAIVCTVALSLLMALAFRPLRRAAPTTTLVATFAVTFLLQSIALLHFGSLGMGVGVLGELNRTIDAGPLLIRKVTIVAVAVGAVLLAGTVLLLNRTSIGLQMRAAAADSRTAQILGVRTDTVILFAFLLAGFLAAAAGILLTVQTPVVTPDYGIQVTILALVGVVVGGLERLWTATLGGFAIGFAFSFIGSRLPTDKTVFLPSFVFVLVIAVLLLRPDGLFAPLQKRTVERV